MGKILLEDFGPMQTSWLRYSSAFLTGVVFITVLRRWKPEHVSPLSSVFKPYNFLWLSILGLCTFFGSSYLQYTGLAQSTSTENSLLVATEPLIAVILAVLLIGERFTMRHLVSLCLAFVGFCLLSKLNIFNLHSTPFRVGNIFLLGSIVCEAMYTIISRKLVGRLTPVTIFGASLPVGFAAFTLLLLVLHEPLPLQAHFHGKTLLALFWVGPIGTTIAYIFWSVALVNSPVIAVSLTLFLQPLLGATNGILFLHEHLSISQICGGLVILFALFVQTFQRKKL